MKTSEAIFSSSTKDRKIIWHNVYDLERFLADNEGIDLYWTCKQANKLSKKYKMYAYWHVAILEAAVRGYTNAGYEGIDKVKADYLLRAELAKDFIIKPDGSRQVIMLDKSGMSAQRLHKLLSDAIFFLESELQVEVVDGQEWKLNRSTGGNFKTVK